MDRPLLAGKYLQYKGNYYDVLGFGTNTETEEPYVIYQALYGDYRIWTRPVSVFFGDVTREGNTMPRFTFVGGARLRRLSQERQVAARNWLMTVGRPLEQALYAWAFEAGSTQEVLHALSTYRNADGGFGHGLEPDLQTPDSSALATSIALQTLRHIQAPADEPLVQGAMEWLRDHFDADKSRWDFMPDTVENAPHAPWWTPGEKHAASFGEYLINPRAELVGFILDYAQDFPNLTGLTEATIAHIEATAPDLNMHELLTTKRLIGSSGLNESQRDRLVAAAFASLPGTVATSAEELDNYSLHPTQLAQHPRSVFAEALREGIQMDLDYLVDTQEVDGSWRPTWSWGGMYDEAWSEAERQWTSAITLERLIVLRDWGRLSL